MILGMITNYYHFEKYFTMTFDETSREALSFCSAYKFNFSIEIEIFVSIVRYVMSRWDIQFCADMSWVKIAGNIQNNDR